MQGSTVNNQHHTEIAFACVFVCVCVFSGMTCRQLVFYWTHLKPYGLDFLLSHGLVYVGGMNHSVFIYLFACSPAHGGLLIM